MFSAKTSIVVILLVWFCLTSDCDAWRRRRRRRCPVKNCDITSWSYWRHCTADRCGQEGYRSRSRMIVSKPSCGGKDCPDNLFETRQCYGSRAVDCELSYWSEWSGCTTACGTRNTVQLPPPNNYRTMWRYMLIFPHKNTILPTYRLFQWRNS